jgi:hypothetical protein
MQIKSVIKYWQQIKIPLARVYLLLLITPHICAQITKKNKSPKTGKQIILKLSTAEYEDRVQAIWVGQMLAAEMGMPFEHHTASVEWVKG